MKRGIGAIIGLLCCAAGQAPAQTFEATAAQGILKFTQDAGALRQDAAAAAAQSAAAEDNLPRIDFSNAPDYIKNDPYRRQRVAQNVKTAAEAYGGNIKWTEMWRRGGFGERGGIAVRNSLVRIQWGHPVAGEGIAAVTTGNRAGYNVLINVNVGVPDVSLLIHEFAHLYQYQKGYTSAADILLHEQLGGKNIYDLGGLPGQQNEGLRLRIADPDMDTFEKLSSRHRAEEAASILEYYWGSRGNGSFHRRLEHFADGILQGVHHVHDDALEK